MFFDRTLGAVRSPRWNIVRKQHLFMFPTCAVCDSKGSILNPLQVHHITPFWLDPSKELDMLNLITLCDVHHLWIGHLGSFKSFNKDVRKDAKRLLDKIKNRP